MSKVVIKWDDAEVKKVLGLSMQKQMGVACLKLEAQAKQNVMGGSSGLHSRTGALAGSISSDWTGRGSGGSVTGAASRLGATAISVEGGQFPEIKGVVGSNLVYAAMQELGKENHKAKKVKYLTIPLDAAKTGRSGVSRGKARDFKNTFVKEYNGNLYIVRPKGKGLEYLFLLKKSVNIPARPYLRPAMEKAMPYIVKIFKDL